LTKKIFVRKKGNFFEMSNYKLAKQTKAKTEEAGGEAMYYPDDVIRQVRESNDIVSVISDYIPLTKKGNNYFGLCPFHGEKTASFSVNEKEQFFHCFGCGVGGNVYTFLMQMENLTFSEAVKNLADRAHIELPEAQLSDEEKKQMLRRERMKEAATEAARFYYYQLTKSPNGAQARAYLQQRAVTDAFIRKFGLGYAPVSRDALVRYLQSKGYSPEELSGAGLISGKDGRYFDRFFNRVMFPIFDSGGKIIAFGGRVMGQGEPKYLNSSDSEIFNKRRNLYGMNLAKKSRRSQIIMVEGYMDVLSLHQAGFDNAVASLGTALTPEQCLLIKRYASDVVLCYDSDQAGTNAARRGIPLLEEAGLRVRVLQVKDAKDPDEYIKKFGNEAFENLLASAMDPVDFELMVLNREQKSDTVEGKIKVLQGMTQKLAQISSDVERELHIRDVAAKMQVSEKSLAKEVEEIRSNSGLLEYKGTTRRRSVEQGPDMNAAQRQLLAALMQQPSLYTTIRRYITPEDFPERDIGGGASEKVTEHPKDNIYRKVADYIFGMGERGEPYRLADIISQVEDIHDQEKVSSLAMLSLPENLADWEKFLTETIRTLKLQRLEEELRTQDDLTALQAAIQQKKELQNLQIHLPG
jgi:DNA primase